MSELGVIRASGGVVWRMAPEFQAIVIHRPRYNDWSIPKGKAEDAESFEQAAVREIEEEIGLTCTLGEELKPVVRIAVDHHTGLECEKTIRYWLMKPVNLAQEPSPDFDEVDELRWVTEVQADELLSYEEDKLVFREAAQKAQVPR